MINGTKFTMVGTSDYPVCDCCGKTNLVRAVVVRNEDSEEFNVGVICASKVLRQMYMGKAARASDEWKKRNGYSPANLVAA